MQEITVNQVSATAWAPAADLQNLPIDTSSTSVRARQAIRTAAREKFGLEDPRNVTPAQIAALDDMEWMMMRGVGRTTVREIRRLLNSVASPGESAHSQANWHIAMPDPTPTTYATAAAG